MNELLEEYTEDIDKCTCGSTKFILETTGYLFFSKEGKEVTTIKEGEETDNKITCSECEKVLRSFCNQII